MDNHLSEEELLLYAARSGSCLMRLRCWLHLRKCRRCRTLAEAERQEMRQQRQMGQLLRGYNEAINYAETTMKVEHSTFMQSIAPGSSGASAAPDTPPENRALR